MDDDWGSPYDFGNHDFMISKAVLQPGLWGKLFIFLPSTSSSTNKNKPTPATHVPPM
jgi:hypothetical protein